MSVHFSVRFFCDEASKLGPGTTVTTGDIPDAFKKNPVNPVLLPLFVTSVPTPSGRRYFCDLANCFGWLASEFGFQAQVALLNWIIACAGLLLVFWFVDNYFQLHPPGSAAAAHRARLLVVLRELGVDIHKHTEGTRCPVLGWIADLAYVGPEGPLVLILPDDKQKAYSALFNQWASQSEISVADVLTAKGIGQFLSSAVKAGAAYVAPVIALLSRALLKQQRLRAAGQAASSEGVLVFINPPVAEFFRFWDTVLRRGTKVFPMVQSFGPRASASFRIWVDSSPQDGGGVGCLLYDPRARSLEGFRHVFTKAQRAACVSSGSPVVRNAPVAEAMGIHVAVSAWGRRCCRSRVLLGTDSETSMLAHRKAFSTSEGMRAPLRATRLLASRHHICLRVRSMCRRTPAIVITDLLGRGQFADAKLLALRVFGCHLHILVDVEI
jgi:hypothetical protein